jgi:hypothetical protein
LHTFRNAGYFIITIFDFDASGLIPLLRNTFETLHNGREGQKSGKKWVQVAFTDRELHLLLKYLKVIIAFFAYIQGSSLAQGRRRYR